MEIEVKSTKYGRKLTIIKIDVNGNRELLTEIARELKRKLGAGGTVKDGVILIQGDHRPRKHVIEAVIAKHLRRA